MDAEANEALLSDEALLGGASRASIADCGRAGDDAAARDEAAHHLSGPGPLTAGVSPWVSRISTR